MFIPFPLRALCVLRCYPPHSLHAAGRPFRLGVPSSATNRPPEALTPTPVPRSKHPKSPFLPVASSRRRVLPLPLRALCALRCPPPAFAARCRSPFQVSLPNSGTNRPPEALTPTPVPEPKHAKSLLLSLRRRVVVSSPFPFAPFAPFAVLPIFPPDTATAGELPRYPPKGASPQRS